MPDSKHCSCFLNQSFNLAVTMFLIEQNVCIIRFQKIPLITDSFVCISYNMCIYKDMQNCITHLTSNNMTVGNFDTVLNKILLNKGCWYILCYYKTPQKQSRALQHNLQVCLQEGCSISNQDIVGAEGSPHYFVSGTPLPAFYVLEMNRNESVITNVSILY